MMRFKGKRLCALLLASTMLLTSFSTNSTKIYADEDASVVEEVSEQNVTESTEEVTTEEKVVEKKEDATESTTTAPVETTEEQDVESAENTTSAEEVTSEESSTEVTEEATEVPTEASTEVSSEEGKLEDKSTEETTEEKAEEKGTIFVKINEGGTVKFIYADDTSEVIENKEGKTFSTKNGVEVLLTEEVKDYYKLSEVKLDSVVKIEVESKSDYKVKFFTKVIDDGGKSKKDINETSYKEKINIGKETKLEFSFEEVKKEETSEESEAATTTDAEQKEEKAVKLDFSDVQIGSQILVQLFSSVDPSIPVLSKEYLAVEDGIYSEGKKLDGNTSIIIPNEAYTDEYNTITIASNSMEGYLKKSFTVKSESEELYSSKEDYETSIDLDLDYNITYYISCKTEELLETESLEDGSTKISWYLDNGYWEKYTTNITKTSRYGKGSGKTAYYNTAKYQDKEPSRAKAWSSPSWSFPHGTPKDQMKAMFGDKGSNIGLTTRVDEYDGATILNSDLRDLLLKKNSDGKYMPNVGTHNYKNKVTLKVTDISGIIGGAGNKATFTLGSKYNDNWEGTTWGGLKLKGLVCNTRHAAATTQFIGEKVESNNPSDWAVDVDFTVTTNYNATTKKGSAVITATLHGYDTGMYADRNDDATYAGQSWRCSKSWKYKFTEGERSVSLEANKTFTSLPVGPWYDPRLEYIYDPSGISIGFSIESSDPYGDLTANVDSADGTGGYFSSKTPSRVDGNGTQLYWFTYDDVELTTTSTFPYTMAWADSDIFRLEGLNQNTKVLWYAAHETVPCPYISQSGDPTYYCKTWNDTYGYYYNGMGTDKSPTAVDRNSVTFNNTIAYVNSSISVKKINKVTKEPVPNATYSVYYIPEIIDSDELARTFGAGGTFAKDNFTARNAGSVYATPIGYATTNADGVATYKIYNGYYGTYYFVESNAPATMLLDTDFIAGKSFWRNDDRTEGSEIFSQKKGQPIILGASIANGIPLHEEKPAVGTVEVHKYNAETGENTPTAGTSFAGITYTIYADGGYEDKTKPIVYCPDPDNPTVTKTWATGQPITRMDGSKFELVCNADGLAEIPTSASYADMLPLGNYYIQETKGNEYYSNDDPTKYTFKVSSSGRIIINAVGKNSTTGGSGNTPYRGDISLLKTRSDNGRPIGNIPFLITNTKTGEKHVIVTDVNGVYNSSLYVGTPISERNKNDDLIDKEKEGVIKTSEIGEPCGIWFGVGADNKPTGTEADINRGSLVTVENAENSADAYCKYTVKELRCERNSNMEELYSGTVTVIADTVVAVGNGSVPNTPMTPSVSTNIVCEETKTRLMAKGKEVNAIDTVTCNNLELGHKYQIVSEIYDTETKEVMTDSDGKLLESQSEIFIADENTLTFKENEQGNSINIDVKFTFNSENMGGTSGVAQLNLYDITAAEEDGETDAYQEKYIVAEEHDFTLENQTIVIPRIETDVYDVTFQNAQGNPTYKEIDFGKNAQGTEGQEGDAQGDDTQAGINNDTAQTDGNTNTENNENTQETTDETKAEDTPSVDSEVEVEVSHEELFTRDVTINIKDKVSLYNFLVGETYTVTGQVYKIELDENNKEYITKEKVAEVTLNDAKTVTIQNPTEDFITLDYTIEDKGVDTTRKHYYVVFEQVYATAGLREPVLVADHEDPNDERQQIKTLGLFSHFRDTTSKTKVIKATKPGETTPITDVLYVQGMIIGEEYTLHNEMYDKDTGEVVVINDVPVSQTKVFTATKEDMEFNFDYKLDTSSLGGKDVVFGEWIEYKGVTILSHRDLRDKQELGKVPTVKTKAHDVQTLTSIGSLDSTTIVDTVTVTNSQVGVPQTIKGILMDKATGKPLGEAEGYGPFEAKTVIENPEKKDYEATVEFKIPDSTILEGKNIVVFEGLYINNEKVAFHEDINDEGQTITFCKERTTANWSNGTKLVNAEDIEYTLYDVVHYTNLVPGKKYEQVGKLWQDDGTGKAVPFLRNGVQVESRVEFTPETAEGDITLEFKINTADLEGQQIVVFEDLYYNATKIATHSDINDKDQTVYIPKLRTTANWDNGTKLVIAKDKEYTINDVVHYSNLIVGKEYTVTGTLMQDNGDGVAVAYTGEDGNPLTSSVTFTAETSEGDITVPFKINTLDLEGQTFVVFEDLYHLGNKIGTHSDITDKDQTVYIPQIGTTATSKDGEKTLKVGEKVKLVDEVEYENLIEGETYTLKGYVVKKKGKGKYSKVTKKQEVEFVAKNSGITKMNFTIDTTKLQGKELVVFEYVYDIDGHLVAVHEDIDDEGQTVKVEELPDTPSIPRTLDNIFAILLLGAAFILLGVGIVSKSNKKKEQ